MKPFWRTFFASALSLLLIGGILIVFLVVGVSSAVSGLTEQKPFKVKDNSVLQIEFKSPISEKSYAEFDKSSFSLDQGFGLREIMHGLEEAKTDDKIKGVLINLSDVPAGMATVEEIRNALIDFKGSGKFVYAYSEVYSQKAYYIATVADKIMLYPEGLLSFQGLGAELMFLKGAIDKLGVDVQIIRGSNNKFKSAVEPLMYDSMSEANREQTMTYMNALWNQMLAGISETRGVSREKLNEIADSIYLRTADDALKYKLVDELTYEDQLYDGIREKLGVKADDDLNIVSFQKYCSKMTKRFDNKNKKKDKNIAVVYAVGGIESGKGNATTIGSETIAKAIREARENKDIKAIVLRVNSPGGSALASDVIWREVIKVKEAGKPIVVSMGDVAASGGYYISCAADKIYAQPNTITGSIGVFGIIPNIGPMMKEKLGVTFDRVQTNYHSVMTINKALTEDEKRIIQQGVDDIYSDFTQKVADGRPSLEQPDVDSIGQGRVWAGTDALRIGLVDELGGINDAIAYAAEKANIKIDDVKLEVYPKQEEDQLMEFLEAFDSEGAETKINLRTKYESFLTTVEKVSSMRGVQARLPFEIVVE